MTKIKKYVEHIADELEGAKEYAEKALEAKSIGDNERYAKYRSMAQDEMNHAAIIHDIAAKDIERLETVFPVIPENMMETWERSHREYVEKAAWIKQMLAM